MMVLQQIFCFSIDGRPIYLIRLGTMDIKGLLRSVREDGFVKQVSSDFEYKSREYVFLFMPCLVCHGLIIIRSMDCIQNF